MSDTTSPAYTMEGLIPFVRFTKLREDAIIPKKATEYSAGFDLYATEDVPIVGGAGSVIVPTGVRVRLTEGTYGRIAIRSGLAVNQHLCVSGGVIDRDYTGEIKVIVYCNKIFTKHDRVNKPDTHDGSYAVTVTSTYMIEPHTYTIKKGERFAQLIVEETSDIEEALVTPDASVSQHEGFGSTGKM